MRQSQQQQHLKAHGDDGGSAVKDAFHFQTQWQQRGRGSLPLKKRRFNQITMFHSDTATDALNSPSLEPDLEGSKTMSCRDMIDSAVKSCSTADEEIAALALVAAATTSPGRISFLSKTSNKAVNASILRPYDREPTLMSPLSSNFVHDDEMGATAASGDGLYEEPFVQHQLQAFHDAGSTQSFMQDSASDDGNQSYHQQDTCNLADGATAIPAVTSPHPRHRIHHPPLSSPLPGGCHGRTSRNNSYCRRTPCYNSSKYCKLHYQHYIVQGGSSLNVESQLLAGQWQQAIEVRDPADFATDTEHFTELISSKAPENSCVGNGTNGGGSSVCSVSADQQPRHHQDKRYNGLNPDDVQCQATTTRGRPCAYVAANGCKYCHLHADYDTNPPPRRGGNGSGSVGGGSNNAHKTKTSPLVDDMNCASNDIDNDAVASMMMMATSAVGQAESLSEPVTPLTAYSQYMSSPIAMKPDYTGRSSYRQSSNSRSQDSIPPMISYLEETSKSNGIRFPTSPKSQRCGELSSPMATTNTAIDPPLPFPLLNSIPSEQWANKLVLISTGPLVNRTGRVLKWGNGWITVRAATGGCVNESEGAGELLHNRRAIELYLLPDEFQAATAEGGKYDGEQNDENQTNTIMAQFLRLSRKDHAQEPDPTLTWNVVSHCNQVKLQFSEHWPITAGKEEVVDSPDLQTESDIGTDSVVRELENNVLLTLPRKELPPNKFVTDNVSTEVDLVRWENSNDAAPTDSKQRMVPREQQCTDNVQKPPRIEDHEEKAGSNPDINLSTPAKASESYKQHLTLMEELILAQTGRRVQNLEMIFDSGGARRTIHRPERYEDKAMIEKKRHRQQHGLSSSESDNEGTETNALPTTKKERLSSGDIVKTKKKVPTNEKLHIRISAKRKAPDDEEESKGQVPPAPPTPNEKIKV